MTDEQFRTLLNIRQVNLADLPPYHPRPLPTLRVPGIPPAALPRPRYYYQNTKGILKGEKPKTTRLIPNPLLGSYQPWILPPPPAPEPEPSPQKPKYNAKQYLHPGEQP